MSDPNQKAVVYINGQFLSGDQAKVSVFDHGFMYGDAVYDTARVHDRYLFKIDEHLDRLFRSARGIGLAPPASKEEIKRAVIETVKRNALENAQIRIFLTRGVGAPGLDPKLCAKPTLIILALEVKAMLGHKPLRLMISTVRKKSFSVDSKIKTVNYMDSILAKFQANVSKFDDAIMLDQHGYVAEASAANVFIIENGRVVTPLPTACLAGVTRATVLDLTKELHIEVAETFVTPQDVYAADECFLTGTGIDGVIPVGEVDGRKIGEECPGPITRKINDAYRELTKTKFLTPIYE